MTCVTMVTTLLRQLNATVRRTLATTTTTTTKNRKIDNIDPFIMTSFSEKH